MISPDPSPPGRGASLTACLSRRFSASRSFTPLHIILMQMDTTGSVVEHGKQLSKLNAQEDRQQLIRLCAIISVVYAFNLGKFGQFFRVLQKFIFKYENQNDVLVT